MSSAKLSSKSSSRHSEDCRRKSLKHSSNENHRPHHLQSNRKVTRSDSHKYSQEIDLKSGSHKSEGSVIQDEQGEELYRLDDGAEIWRTCDGSVIFWEVHKLTFEEFSRATWNWAERGLDQIQKSYVASIHPPHGGHQSRLLDFFCTHRQKLIRDHIQRIYSDLYLILRTWTELKHYLRQLNEKTISQESSKTVKKIENRLTFHLMVSLREYNGLPLDPKHPDKPSWPSLGDETQSKNISRLKAEALASTSNSISNSSGSEKSFVLKQDTDRKALCSHCHQVLELSPIDKPAEHNVTSLKAPSLPEVQSESCTKSDISQSNSCVKDRKVRSKSISRKEKKHKSESKSDKESARSRCSQPPQEKCDKPKKHKEKSSDDSDNMSLISFDSNQFSNTFGTMFKLM